MSARRFIPQAVPRAALLDTDIPNSGLGYKVLEAVSHYSQMGPCIASNETLAERAGCSERTVRRWLTTWIDKGRICDLSRPAGDDRERGRSRQLVLVGMPASTTSADAPKCRRRRRPAHATKAQLQDSEVATAGHRTPVGDSPIGCPHTGAPAPSGACAEGARAPAGREPLLLIEVLPPPDRPTVSPRPGGARCERGRAASGQSPSGRASQPPPLVQVERFYASGDLRQEADLSGWLAAKRHGQPLIERSFPILVALLRMRERASHAGSAEPPGGWKAARWRSLAMEVAS